MARQTGTVKITGTIDNLCFYTMEGKHYVRMKSSLTAKRVKTDAKFALTMVYAGLMSKASKIASAVYQQIEKKQREKGLYRRITGAAIKLLKSGIDPEAAETQLHAMYVPMQAPSTTKRKVILARQKERIAYGDSVLSKIFKERAIGNNIKLSHFKDFYSGDVTSIMDGFSENYTSKKLPCVSFFLERK